VETGPLWRAAAAIRNPVSRESGPGGDPRVSGVSAAVSRGDVPRRPDRGLRCQPAFPAPMRLRTSLCPWTGSMLRAPMRSVSDNRREFYRRLAVPLACVGS
jgi:hypothetical protein